MQIPAQSWLQQSMKLVALQRDKAIRAQFVSDVSIYEPEMLIFLDETGADRRDSLRLMVSLTACHTVREQ